MRARGRWSGYKAETAAWPTGDQGLDWIMSKLTSTLVLGGCLAVSFGAAALGGVLTASSLKDWYSELRKPEWSPPDQIFGPVWSALYTAMGTAMWLTWRGAHQQPERLRRPLVWFGAQLALNVGWSGLFFGLRQPGLAVGEIVVLWAAIAATTISFWRVSRSAGLLMLPYLAWVAFAAALNFRVWQLNRS